MRRSQSATKKSGKRATKNVRSNEVNRVGGGARNYFVEWNEVNELIRNYFVYFVDCLPPLKFGKNASTLRSKRSKYTTHYPSTISGETLAGKKYEVNEENPQGVVFHRLSRP